MNIVKIIRSIMEISKTTMKAKTKQRKNNKKDYSLGAMHKASIWILLLRCPPETHKSNLSIIRLHFLKIVFCNRM